MSLNYIPPIRTKNKSALRSGTVMLSIPFGVSASSIVANIATPNEANSKVVIWNGHRYENASRLRVTLIKVTRNIAVVPSILFFESLPIL